ncbi:MAG: aspartyl protease family protein [Leadbetterella sp.]|nr:aspartyl protease family protein [Leadbetterella sp.]
MLQKTFVLFLFPILASAIGIDTLSFRLNKQSNICIKARINNSDTLTLMFHTSSTGLTVTRESLKEKILLKNKQNTNIQTWGGKADAEFSEHNTLFINKLTWKDLTIFVNENSGPETDGKFGYDLFTKKIVSIDYDKNLIMVNENLPKNLKGYQKMNLFFSNGSMFIEGKLEIGDEVYQDKFMFHSGYGGAILLDPQIAEKYNMKSLKTISTSELKDSYGNVFKIETKLLPKAKIGKKTIKNVPLSFAARSSDIPMKVFGNDLLKRFNVIFDFQKNEIYLKPNGLRKMNYNIKK